MGLLSQENCVPQLIRPTVQENLKITPLIALDKLMVGGVMVVFTLSLLQAKFCVFGGSVWYTIGKWLYIQ